MTRPPPPRPVTIYYYQTAWKGLTAMLLGIVKLITEAQSRVGAAYATVVYRDDVSGASSVCFQE